ncbi:MAG TPA: tetratricopeptide repeat protein, partial [Blastocatellia bacterium]|nr:tetratricopeptide repeat protein [Blastocatellia bacterium]
MKHKKQISNASKISNANIRRAKLLFYFCLLPLAAPRVSAGEPVLTGRAILCLLPSLSLLTSVSGQGLSSAHPARESARRGEELRRKWDLAAAETAFREAVRLDPGSREALVGLARIARARFDYAEAIRLLDRAARLHPSSAEVLAEYGAIYLAAEEPRRAIDYFEKAARVEPNSNAVALGRAGVDLLERDYRSAEAHVRRHLAYNPRSARAL